MDNPSIAQRLGRAIPAKAHELQALFWSFLYFFCLLCAYYVLRPIRDEMGVQGGVENLQWLFTATFITMLCAVPLFGWVSSRYPRDTLLTMVYGFFIANILVFHFLFQSSVSTAYVARVFFVWLSVFNLFVVSVFWSFMVELFDNEQAKRLFGFIAAGGSAGAVTGPTVTATLVVAVGTAGLLWVSVFFLSAALVCLYQLRKWADVYSVSSRQIRRRPIGGGLADGVKRVMRSPYLLGICLYVVLYTMLTTFLYFTQATIVRDAFDSAEERTRLFALIDLGTNSLTIGLQLFVTGRLASRVGLPTTLAVVPALLLVGFTSLGFVTTLGVLVGVQILSRAGNYAITRPGREMLFTVLPVDDKYKSKNVIDTVVHRGGDAVSGWAYTALAGLGLNTSGVAWVAIPVALLWLVSGWKLGKRRERLERKASDVAVSAPIGG